MSLSRLSLYAKKRFQESWKNKSILCQYLSTQIPSLQNVAIKQSNTDCIEISWTNRIVSKYHTRHLRAWCNCPICQHQETGQRLVNSSDIPSDIQAANVTVNNDQSISIIWSHDNHKSTFSKSWLYENSYSLDMLRKRTEQFNTIKLPINDAIPKITYESFMEPGDKGLYSMLKQLKDDGLVIVENTPSKKNSVKTIAERIAPISHSFLYGDVFDVIAKKKPVNIAYTNKELKHHLDLAYYESPPGIQLLHALKFDANVIGGESTFVDVFAATSAFRLRYPKHFETFVRVPATFQKHHLDRKNPAFMEYQRPHIQLNHLKEIINVFWSPPFEGPLRIPYEDVNAYYDAYKVFHDLIESGEFQIQFRLNQGETIVFNQRRMLHGRKSFSIETNGIRHLQGTYINIDDVRCRYNALRLQLRSNDIDKRWGNGDYA